jgi:hypothetical protein
MHEKAEVAWRIVGDAWGLKKRALQWIIADHRAPALATLRQFASAPDTLLRLCERHARGARPERRQSGFEPPAQGGLNDTPTQRDVLTPRRFSHSLVAEQSSKDHDPPSESAKAGPRQH